MPSATKPATTASCIILQVFGCDGCALTITGHPAANADALSPPITEKANGKLLAAKTPTRPSGWFALRISGRAAGTQFASGRSIIAW